MHDASNYPDSCYYRELEDEKIIPYVEHVLYQDEHILVADKPDRNTILKVAQNYEHTS